MFKKPQPLTAAQAYERYAAQCSRQECCSHDLLQKMRQRGLSLAEAEDVVARLTDEGFIDDRRYCRAFAHDKIMFSHWGRLRVARELRLRRMASEYIDEALAQIDDDDYRARLEEVLQSYVRTVRAKSGYECRMKLLKHAYSRGYEIDLAESVVDSICAGDGGIDGCDMFNDDL